MIIQTGLPKRRLGIFLYIFWGDMLNIYPTIFVEKLPVCTVALFSQMFIYKRFSNRFVQPIAHINSEETFNTHIFPQNEYFLTATFPIWVRILVFEVSPKFLRSHYIKPKSFRNFLLIFHQTIPITFDGTCQLKKSNNIELVLKAQRYVNCPLLGPVYRKKKLKN